MEFYTSSVAQRTRSKFQEEGSTGLKKKMMKKNGRLGGRKLGATSSYKAFPRKSVNGSRRLFDDDVVEIDRSEFVEDIRFTKRGDEATGSKIRVPCSSLDFSSDSSEPFIDEKEEENCIPVHKQNQYERCRIGQHGELYLIDNRGLLCKSCNNVVLDSRVFLSIRNSCTSGHGTKEVSFTSREVPKKGNVKRISYSKKHSDATGKSRLVGKFNRNSYNHEDSVAHYSSHTSNGLENSRTFRYKGSDEEARGFSRYDRSRSKKEPVKTQKKRANNLEVGESSTAYHKEAYAGNSRRHGESIEEVEEIIAYSSDDNLSDNSSFEGIEVSSEENWAEYMRKNDVDSTEDESEDSFESDDSEYVGNADSSSKSLVEASTESDQVGGKYNNKNQISEDENDDYEDEAESVKKKQHLKRKEVCSKMKKGQKRRESGSFFDESLKRKQTSSRMKPNKEKRKRESYSNESLKKEEVSAKMKKPQMNKKRKMYQDGVQENSAFKDEPTKKSKDKSKKTSREFRTNERESGDKKALKSRNALGKMSHQHTVSLTQSMKKEDCAENTSFYDSAKDPITVIFGLKAGRPISDARRKRSKQTEKANEECEEEEEETACLIRKAKGKKVSKQKEDNEDGANLVVESNKRKSISKKKKDKECGEETKQVEEPSAEDGVSGEKNNNKNNEKSEQVGESSKRKGICGKKYDVRKSISEKKKDNECGEETKQVEEPSAEERVSREKDINKNNENSEQVGESSKRMGNCGNKDDVIGTLLKGLLGIKEPDDEEDLEDTEAKQSSPVEESIPLKFRFDDTDDESPEEEKNEFELMVEGLFDELNYCKQLKSSEISPGPPKAESESEEDAKNPYAGCKRGNHGDLYFDEQIGLRCSICEAIILESKHVLADLVDPPPRRSRRRNNHQNEDLPWNNDHASVINENGNYSQETCTHLEGTVWNTVPGIKEQMYPHQQEGIEFLWKNLAGTIDLSELDKSDLSGGGGCIISHAPGTGKTRLTIVFLEMFLKLFPDIRPVIIAPVSIILTWEEEFKKWQVKFPFHNLNNLEVSGHKDVSLRKNLLRVIKMSAWKNRGGILGMSYSLFEKLAGEKFAKERKGPRKKREKAAADKNLEMLRSILLELPGLVVLDEGHIARNQTSSIWNALSNLKTNKCVILSGTPFQNNFEELFNTLSLVRPEIANKLSADKAFSSESSWQRDKAIENLKTEIAPFVHVHKGSILQKNLPGLRDCLVVLNPDPFQKGIIDSTEKVQKGNTFEYDHKVAMVSVHPSLLLHCGNLSDKERSGFDQTELENMRVDYAKGVKTRFVMELIRLSEASGEKVLIFSQYVQPLQLIKDQLKQAFGWNSGEQMLHIKGKLEQKQRQKIINVFNDPNSVAKVMLASTKCCSEGIHLVGASRVVLLDVVWNPSVERQAICRAYRIGQKKVVHTYHLMTFGTNEGEKYIRQLEKDRISELVFCASSPSSKSTEDERNEKDLAAQLEDNILEDMVGEPRLKDMFRKILQPKEANFFETFGSE